MGKEILDLCLDGNELVDHRDLLAIQYKLPAVHIDSSPKLFDLLPDLLAHICDTVKLLDRCQTLVHLAQ